MALKRVPASPNPDVLINDDSNNNRMRFAVRKDYRYEFLRLSKIDPNDEKDDIRICNLHLLEYIDKNVTFTDKKINNTQ
jgi:hypothetical protein